IRDATLKVFDQLGQRPQVRMELGSNEAIKHAIVGGLGLSVLSLHTLTLEGTDGPVAILDIEGFPIMREWYLVYPKGKELSLVAQAFLDFALEIEPSMRERMALMWPKISRFLKTTGKKKSPARRVKKA
ncbi:MAG: LysR substrate-binding domain-containing protein, partial [Gammaproteobacteria bacterium]